MEVLPGTLVVEPKSDETTVSLIQGERPGPILFPSHLAKGPECSAQLLNQCTPVWMSHNTGRPCFIVLCFPVLRDTAFSLNWKVCGNPVSSKSSKQHPFPTVFAHFVCLHHILAVLTVFQTSPSLVDLLW